MALFSWFVENEKKTNKKHIRTDRNLIKPPESSKYIANYTMWPTAKIRKGILIKLPIHPDVNHNSTKESNEKKLPLDVPLIVNE
jgi:hypothetical protein